MSRSGCREFTPFEINPFKLRLVVAAVSGVSYVSYLLRLWWGEDRGLIMAGLLGGAYSSTVTTVVLARQSKKRLPCAVGFAGAIVAATGMMYLRLWILLLIPAPADLPRPEDPSRPQTVMPWLTVPIE
jgi:uncharacterized membrane protein (DUF4010 family)